MLLLRDDKHVVSLLSHSGSRHLFSIVDPDNVVLIVIISLANLGLVIRGTACNVNGGSAVAAGIGDSEKACDVVAASGMLLLRDGGRATSLLCDGGRATCLLLLRDGGLATCLLLLCDGGRATCLLLLRDGGLATCLLLLRDGGHSAWLLLLRDSGRAACLLLLRDGGRAACWLLLRDGGRAACWLLLRDGGRAAVWLLLRDGGRAAGLLSHSRSRCWLAADARLADSCLSLLPDGSRL
ncbi:MAG: hypothetical protein CML43_14295 [Rhodobacteraceae bacterium]|nr:hypothetical protein [Paracoccaceae bacterium]